MHAFAYMHIQTCMSSQAYFSHTRIHRTSKLPGSQQGKPCSRMQNHTNFRLSGEDPEPSGRGMNVYPCEFGQASGLTNHCGLRPPFFNPVSDMIHAPTWEWKQRKCSHPGQITLGKGRAPALSEQMWTPGSRWGSVPSVHLFLLINYCPHLPTHNRALGVIRNICRNKWLVSQGPSI